MVRKLGLALWLVVVLLGCDNVGRIFNPNGNPGNGGGSGSGVQEMVVGGNAEENSRPRIEAVFPKGGGWPVSVPIVVVFDETMNFDTIAPPQATGAAPGLYVRLAGDNNPALPATYDFLFGGQVVVIRPTAPLVNPGGGGVVGGSPDFEIVIQPSVADGDGVTFGGSADNVIAEFTADEATGGSSLNNVENGRILVTLPLDNPTDQPREIPVYAIFTKPADAASVAPPATNFQVRVGGVAVPGSLSFPLPGLLGPDTRVMRFTPTATALQGNAQFEVRVEKSITFNNGAGELEFVRNPVRRFRTIAFTAPPGVLVGNPSPGFPDWVNRGNLESLQVSVDLDATAQSGDTLVVRIYGADRKASEPTDVSFVERKKTLSVGGAQVVNVGFGNAMGTVTVPRFADGELTFAVQSRRGSGRRTGFVLSSNLNPPRQDTSIPDLVQVGPPGTPAGDLFVDQQFAAFYGQATEPLGEAELTVGGTAVQLFASDGDGGFVMKPLNLNLVANPVAYQLTMTDAAGNVSPNVFAGRIVPRGVVTGNVSAGELEVEVYDEATFRAVPGATVVVQPDPASNVGRMVTNTSLSGRAFFTGLTAQPHTITVAIGGYDISTLMDTSAGYVSLPLRPINDAVADFGGTAAFPASPGATVLVGHNLIDDVLQEDIQTPSSAPTAIPTTSIRPNRMQVITAFAGLFEPVTVPTYSYLACQMCGLTGFLPSAPGEPVVPGQSTVQNLALLQTGSNFLNLAPSTVNFGLANGLDTGNLTGNPTTRIVGNLLGFAGQTLFGVGFAQPTGAPTYTVNGSFPPSMLSALAAYSPVLFASAEATDGSGNVSRHHGFINVVNGSVPPIFNPPSIPTIIPPGGPFAGPPLITYDDYLSTTLPGLGFLQVTATQQAGGRRWTVLRQDTDGVNLGATLQMPSLAGTGAVGLAPGRWSVRTETSLIVSTSFANDRYVLEEIRRQQVLYARAAAVQYIIN